VPCDRSLTCDVALAAVLDDEPAVALNARAHVRSCARCRRALGRQRSLHGELRRLGPVPVPGEVALAGETLVATILARLDSEDRRSSRRARWISSCAVAGAVAGGVVAGAVAITRGRRVHLGL
jgi:hypothetical protein